MTDVGFFGPFTRPAEPKTQGDTLHAPAPQPLSAPVLIYDCVTPLGGETLLSLLMKKLAERDQP